jgi:hypothetical protein
MELWEVYEAEGMAVVRQDELVREQGSCDGGRVPVVDEGVGVEDRLDLLEVSGEDHESVDDCVMESRGTEVRRTVFRVKNPGHSESEEDLGVGEVDRVVRVIGG